MYKIGLVALSLMALAICKKHNMHHSVDPFAILDKQMAYSIAYQYVRTWRKLFRAAAARALGDGLEHPQIIFDSKKYQINLNVVRLNPKTISVKVQNKNVIVKGKYINTNDIQKSTANHFVQSFVLPAGTKPDEVTATLNDRGILSIIAPKHDLPPPPPEKVVPIQLIMLKEKTTEEPTEKSIKVEETTKIQEIKETPEPKSTPVEKTYVETTTHERKIKKKELKTSSATAKDNEAGKRGKGNGLDYSVGDEVSEPDE